MDVSSNGDVFLSCFAVIFALLLTIFCVGIILLIDYLDIIMRNMNIFAEVFHVRKFWGFYDNGKYRVGCNGGTIYVYDENDTELAKFRDIKYTYAGAFKPGTNIFVAKSTEGKLAVYDLDMMTLIKKITITTLGAQDQGFAFSYSGDLFYNIECPNYSTATQLTVYDGFGFSKKAVYFADDRKMVLDHIEVYPDEIYLLGFIRGDDGVLDYGFVSKYADGKIIGLKEIKSSDYAIESLPQKWAKTDYEYLEIYKSWELHGFTEKDSERITRCKPKKPKITIKQIYEANS